MSVLFGVCVLSASVPVAHGAKGGSSPRQHSLESNEDFHANFKLLPTTNAPSNARGTAKIESQNEAGIQNGTMDVTTRNLPDGTYTVSVIKASDSSSMDIGEITVGDTNSDNGDDNGLSLPPDLDPNDIAQVVVSDASGQLLVGDMSDSSGGSKSNFHANVPLTPGDAAPDASGFAQLHSTVRKGKTHNQFLLIGRGVPPKSTFSVEVDGTVVDTVKSNKRGKVMVRKLPSGITDLSTVRLLDSSNGEVVRADF